MARPGQDVRREPTPEDYGATQRDIDRLERVVRVVGEPFSWMVRLAILVTLVGLVMVMVGLTTQIDLTEVGTLLTIRGAAVAAAVYLIWKALWHAVVRPLLRMSRRLRAAEDYRTARERAIT